MTSSPAPDLPAFIRANTEIAAVSFAPEIRLHLATEITPIWRATEDWLHQHGLAPPFWAFAWPGGQALARHILDRPALVRGARVLDFAAGGGVAAIACAMAGAATVEAADIDPFARAAIAMNATLNGMAVTVAADDVVGDVNRWDLILCGDVCYEAPMTSQIMPWLRDLSRTAQVWIADPGRAYLPKTGLTEINRYSVPTLLELEDRSPRDVVLYRLTR